MGWNCKSSSVISAALACLFAGNVKRSPKRLHWKTLRSILQFNHLKQDGPTKWLRRVGCNLLASSRATEIHLFVSLQKGVRGETPGYFCSSYMRFGGFWLCQTFRIIRRSTFHQPLEFLPTTFILFLGSTCYNVTTKYEHKVRTQKYKQYEESEHKTIIMLTR